MLGFELAYHGRSPPWRLHRLAVPPCYAEDVRRLRPIFVNLDRITTSLGFSYAQDGWHPYLWTLRELERDPWLTYEDSTLYRYYQGFRPRTMQEALLDDSSEALWPLNDLPPWFASFPWTLTGSTMRRWANADARARTVAPGRYEHFGPLVDGYGERKFQRLIAVLESLRTTGYRPQDYSNGCVLGYFVVRNGEFRFVATEGQHRLAAFKILGIEKVAVVPQLALACLDWDRLKAWTSAGRGLFPTHVAEMLFELLFTERGWSRACRLGLAQPSTL